MQIRIAKVISYLLHPLLMPLLLLFIVFNTDSYIQLATSLKVQKIIYTLVFTTTFLIPASFSFVLFKNGMIQSMHMETKEERKMPYLVTCIFFFFTFYLLKQVQISSLVFLLFLGCTMALLLTMLINLRWKISAHMVGIGGVVGALIGISLRLYLDYRLLLFVFLLLSGILGTSRMLLKAHSPAQIYAGFFVGLWGQLSLFLII